MSRERTHSISPTRVRAVNASPVRSQPLLIGKQSTPQSESRKLDDLDFSIIPTEAGDGPSMDPNATFEKPKRTVSRTGTITKGKRPVFDKTVDLNEKTAIITNPRDRSISKERPASKPRISGECLLRFYFKKLMFIHSNDQLFRPASSIWITKAEIWSSKTVAFANPNLQEIRCRLLHSLHRHKSSMISSLP